MKNGKLELDATGANTRLISEAFARIPMGLERPEYPEL